MILFLRSAPLCTYDVDFAELEEKRVELSKVKKRYEQKNCVSLSQQLYSEQTYLVKSR